MMKRVLWASIYVGFLFWAAGPAEAAPFAASDPVAGGATAPTHCGLYLDAAAKVEVPVQTDASGVFCKFDMAAVSVGAHTVKATFIRNDPIWGTLEGVQSAPLTFTRPGVPAIPAGLILRAN